MQLSELKPNPDNPRIIKDDKFRKLVTSIQDFPKMMALRPMVIDATGTVLGGNMRLKALQELKFKEIPDDWVKKASDLTEDEIKRFIVVDNVGFGEHDWDALANGWDLDELQEWGLDIPDFMNKQETTEDDYEIPDEIETDIVAGDLFEIGQHRLLCGDSTNSDHVSKLMDKDIADLVFTDPPYGVSYQSNMRVKSKKFEVLENDDQFITDWINCLPIFSKGFVFVWTSWKVMDKWIEFLKPIGEMTNVIIWNKGGGGIGDLKGTFSTDFELALVYNRDANITGKRLGSVWSVNKDGAMTYKHPTQKPVQLAAIAIDNITTHRGLILDLFLGSGTTMVAAHQLNRKCYGIEIDPKYCEVIIQRMLKLDPAIEIKKNGVPYEVITGEKQVA